MSWSKKVVWSEGMFLQPQHFQQQDRHFEHALETRVRWISPHPWGFSRLELDQDALATGKISITAARGVMTDGTPFDIPEHDAAPLSLAIPEKAKNQTLFLSIAKKRPGTVEIELATEGNERKLRYQAEDVDVSDNTVSGGSVAPMRVAGLSVRLLLESEQTDGWDGLGVARIIERRADDQVVIDAKFIPPCLTSRASPVVTAMIQELGDSEASVREMWGKFSFL